MALSRLTLNDFRNHAVLEIRPHAQFLALHGSNGAGKTNILEAVSLLVPGRGLRRAAMLDMPRKDGSGGFAIVAEVRGNVIGTGVSAEQPERRKVRVNESNAAINSLAEWLSVIWLTPTMDRLFADGAAARRRSDGSSSGFGGRARVAGTRSAARHPVHPVGLCPQGRMTAE